jgi:predicted nucleic acid-binding protein
MTADQAAEGLSLVLQAPISTLAGRLTAARALAIALETGLTAWDTTYIAAAERADATLWTADRELFTKGRKVFGRINLLLAESGDPA